MILVTLSSFTIALFLQMFGERKIYILWVKVRRGGYES
jgi:hypothetical protein